MAAAACFIVVTSVNALIAHAQGARTGRSYVAVVNALQLREQVDDLVIVVGTPEQIGPPHAESVVPHEKTLGRCAARDLSSRLDLPCSGLFDPNLMCIPHGQIDTERPVHGDAASRFAVRDLVTPSGQSIE